jgi:hypothetical protein
MRRQSRVFVDGALIGLVDDPRDLVTRMREMRRNGGLSTEVNVSYKDFNNDVIIHTDRGRARRPLIVVRDGKPEVAGEDIERLRNNEMTFEDLVRKGAISPPSTPTWRSILRLSWVSVRRTFLSLSTTPVLVSPWAQGWSSRRSGSGRQT